jgi:ATP-dependent Lon protease
LRHAEVLGRYCASTDAAKIDEGIALVQEQLAERTVRAGEEGLFKARARDPGAVRVIHIITARLDAKSDSYFATLPSLRLIDVRIGDNWVNEHERMLTGGFYAEFELGYDAGIAEGSSVRDPNAPGDTVSAAPCPLARRSGTTQVAE